jgi:eukaryotic-like serine/threonine-protein kinase
VPASGGQAEAVKLDSQATSPSFLPDGRQFLFSTLVSPATAEIYLGSLDSPNTQRLTSADSAGAYLSSGWLLWVRAGTLVAQRLDLTRKVLVGDPVTVADPVAVNGPRQAVSVSAAGLVAYRAGGARRRQLAWFDRSGKALGVMGGPNEDNLSHPSVAPDGRRVAVDRTVQDNADIWVLDGTRTSRITFDAAADGSPIWSPDGARIVFSSSRKGHTDLFQKSSSGAGGEELLFESPQQKSATDWSMDGRFILYFSLDPQTNGDLWVLPMDGDRKPSAFLKTSFNELFGQCSPDGRWVAYRSNESGRNEIYIRAFAATASGVAAGPAAGQWQVSSAGGMSPRWRSDGKELYYIGPKGEMMAAPIAATGMTLEPGAPVTLFPTRIVGGGGDNFQGRQYDVTRDGRFLINTGSTTPRRRLRCCRTGTQS